MCVSQMNIIYKVLDKIITVVYRTDYRNLPSKRLTKVVLCFSDKNLSFKWIFFGTLWLEDKVHDILRRNSLRRCDTERRVAADHFRLSQVWRTGEIGRYQDTAINYKPDRQFSNAGVHVSTLRGCPVDMLSNASDNTQGSDKRRRSGQWYETWLWVKRSCSEAGKRRST